MKGTEIVLYLARASNGVIGAEGNIPWRIPGEQRHFKEQTMGKPIVMGRRTFDSLPGLLPGRRHIVMTRDPNWSAPGAEAVHSVTEAIAKGSAPVLAVIGGAEIYELFEPIAHRMELTEVRIDPPGDAHIDAPDPAHWREAAREDFPARDGVPAYSYVTYLRI